MSTVTVIDDDGIAHSIHTWRGKTGIYYATEYYSFGGLNSSESKTSLDEAIEARKYSINANCAKHFEEAPPEKQEKILAYIKEHFQPGAKRAEKYSSYSLKHIVEQGIGEYVGNGELKGAMKRAGFHSSSPPADINYAYALQLR